MKGWYSVSTRLSLILMGLTLGSLLVLSFVLDAALKHFFIQGALARLQRHASTYAAKSQSELNHRSTLEQWADLTARQGQLQVIVFDSKARETIQSEGVPRVSLVKPPPHIISKTLAGSSQQGRFWVETTSPYPWWLYATAPIYQNASSQVFGAVYIAMPLRRPQQFAQQVKGVVFGMAIVVLCITALTAFLLSRSLTVPLSRLHHQAEQLKAGDYTARSHLQGKGELAQLSTLLDQMTDKLATTLQALKAQENARRELVANVSHDLRTPLATLRVELEAVLDGVVEGEQATQYLRRACRETDYLANLVNQLLLLARADAGQLSVSPQAVSAVAIAQECLSRMEVAASLAQLQLELQAIPNLPLVRVDPELTGQVILNLLDNAIKYAPGSGTIKLEILSVIERQQQQYIPVKICDRGPGIAPEILPFVIERFYRGNEARPRGGFGLGLAIAHQICQLQGCILQIQSQPHQGTVVTLLLPVAI
ncbi:MAG: HAMP domain-containing histidine kinase [Rivularia sp. (in: Bacteria)]|nr:HAMP domain-containing histidine kinase [Rivularia sp. MS3]